jgi:hypothetical protein
MDLTREKLLGIARYHFHELYPQLPALAGRASDLDDLSFVNRASDEMIPEYIAALHDYVRDMSGAISALNEETGGEMAPDEDDEFSDEGSGDEDFYGPEDFKNFLRNVPPCCNEFLSQAEFALTNDELQDACYRIGFVAGCIEAYGSFEADEAERSYTRPVATAWGYLPYLGCMLDEENQGVDEERLLNDAVFILGMIHGLLWFSDTDFVLEELMDLLNRLPTAQ